MKQQINLVHLYPQEMNIYGDTGNRLILERRLSYRGFAVKVWLIGLGEKLPEDSDIIIGGGGQDAVQSAIQVDLLTKANQLSELAKADAVMLMVCGLYQLFGRRFITSTGEDIKGIGLLPMETRAGHERLIGNMVVDTPWGELVGYENHSGLSVLDDPKQALGRVKKGAGNNGHDKTEGCLHENIFGTYSHGPVLSKNPFLADELIRRAVERKYGVSELKLLDDTLERHAASIAKKRPR